MKKLFVVSLVAVLGMGLAYGWSMTVPFMLDNSMDNTSGTKGMIGVKNTTEADITIIIKYFNADALEAGYDGDNTFLLQAGQARGWRPEASHDPGFEGDGDEIVNGIVAPGVRAASMYWDGSEGDVVGRYQQFNMANGSQSSYLLPPTVLYAT